MRAAMAALRAAELSLKEAQGQIEEDVSVTYLDLNTAQETQSGDSEEEGIAHAAGGYCATSVWMRATIHRSNLLPSRSGQRHSSINFCSRRMTLRTSAITCRGWSGLPWASTD